MKPAAAVVLFALAAATAASAQSLNGDASWGYSRSAYRTGTSTTEDGAFTQSYTLSYGSVLWDPRFAVYSGGLTFNRNALSFGSETSRSDQTGFNAAASLFSQRPFRLALHANRSVGGESANYPATAALTGNLVAGAGAVPELRTGQTEYGLSWVLSAPSLPRVEFSYLEGSGTVAAGPLEADQSTRAINAMISREGPRLSNTLRYQHNSADNNLSSAYEQRYDDLSYELTARANDHTRADVRAGRRTTASRFQAPVDISAAADSFRPPEGGDVALYYGSATLMHQPNARFSADLNLGYNSERSAAAGTGSTLATATARTMPCSGLTLRGSSTYGRRSQEVAGTRIAALTRAVGAGVDYAARLRALHATAGYEADQAWNRSDASLEGRSQAWRARADVGVDIFSFAQLSAGYDRDRSLDQLLTLGNQSQRRAHATARAMMTTRLIVDATYERALVDRGVAPLVFRTRYTQALTTATLQLPHERRAAFTAGEFLNQSFAADERHQYIGFSFAGPLVGRLRLSITARRERTASDQPRLAQDGYYTVGSLDYRLRLFTFGVEYRYTDLSVTTAGQIDPLTFNGNQLALRIGRKFGMTR